MAFKFENISVLIAEDTMPMRKLLSSVLITFGIKNITLASDGEEAFEKFRRANHDIVITDWEMMPTNGLQLTKEIRLNPLSPNRMAPVILVTGYSAWSRVEKARDIGITEFLVKPFSANDIAKRISHVITHPRNFIESPDFFGPDRRRRIDPDYTGNLRRSDDKKKQ